MRRVVAEEAVRRGVDDPSVFVVGELGLRDELTEVGLRIVNQDDYADNFSWTEAEAADYVLD